MINVIKESAEIETNTLSIRNTEIIKILTRYENNSEVQSELVKYYLKKNNVNYFEIKNKLLKELFTSSNKELQQELNNVSKDITIKDLEFIFYSLFDKVTTTLKGIIFTPKVVSEFILKELLQDMNTPDETICDFACGGGEFLVTALKELKYKFPSLSAIEIVEKVLYGADILEENVLCTKILLTLQILSYGEDAEDIKFNIIDADSTLPNILGKFNDERVLKGFDYIVGNPPYVKHQDLGSSHRNYLSSNYKSCDKGNFNLFYAFIELSYNYLKETGKIGYIIPNHLLKMKSAKSLRELLLTHNLITKVVDFKDNQLFENAQTYSAIIFFDKEPKEEIKYKVIDYKIEPRQLLDHREERDFLNLYYNDLDSETINLLSKEQFFNVNKIENQQCKLLIATGIATQKDKLYLIDTKKPQNNNENDNFYYTFFGDNIYKIEKDITMLIIKGSGEKKVNEITNAYEFNRIIYPYKSERGKVVVIPIEEMQEKYPETLKYFEAIKVELGKRNKGKPSVKIWYEYGRSQALNSFIPKIIFPTNSGKPNFSYFSDYALFNNGYAIFGLDDDEYNLDLKVLAKVLNSQVMEYYINLTSYMISGGYYCYQKKYLSRFTIPKFSQSEIDFLKNTNEQEEINSFLVEKYSLII